MKELLQAGTITELKHLQNVAYILEDDSLFNLTGYKVLISQEKNGFIKCAKILHNGKIKLLYFTAGQKSLKNMLSLIDADTFIMIIANIFKTIMDVKNNGFLYCQNIDFSFDKIFIDQHTLESHLVYLPIQNAVSDELDVENELRSNLIKIIASTPAFANPKMNRISLHLSNGSFTLNELYYAIKAECQGGVHARPANDDLKQAEKEPEKKAEKKQIGQPPLTFTSLDSNNPVKFVICTPEFIIGKNPVRVNGVIGFNKAIGRVHCRFLYQNNQYYIVDGDGIRCSTNGTYVNGTKLYSTEPFPVKNGDRIRLANSDFMIQI